MVEITWDYLQIIWYLFLKTNILWWYIIWFEYMKLESFFSLLWILLILERCFLNIADVWLFAKVNIFGIILNISG